MKFWDTVKEKFNELKNYYMSFEFTKRENTMAVIIAVLVIFLIVF
jgi:hypothetical protein